ncbi:hypothetical protein JB92DRAFT_1167930 [Gautieria morchelliformis]|nr:hypothetical protein JB92DRAFT_1167930 [Gautieria morchelliformis]
MCGVCWMAGCSRGYSGATAWVHWTLCLPFHFALHDDHTIETIALFIIPTHRSKTAASAVYMYTTLTPHAGPSLSIHSTTSASKGLCRYIQSSPRPFFTLFIALFCLAIEEFFSAAYFSCPYPSRLHSHPNPPFLPPSFTTLLDGAHEFMNSILPVPPGSRGAPLSLWSVCPFHRVCTYNIAASGFFYLCSFTPGHPGVSKNSRTHAHTEMTTCWQYLTYSGPQSCELPPRFDRSI